jgi:general secretion pathway protein E
MTTSNVRVCSGEWGEGGIQWEQMDTTAYTIEALLGHLTDKGVLSDEQSQEIQSKAPSLRTKLGRTGIGENDDVSPAEIIGAIGLRTSDDKILDEDRVMSVFADAVGKRYHKIDPVKLNSRFVTSLLPRRFAIKYHVLPLFQEGNTLTLAIDNPFNLQLVDELKATTGKEIELVVSARTDILKVITDIYGFRSSVKKAAIQADIGPDIGNLEQLVRLQSQEEIEASDLPIVNAVEYMLRYAFDQRASDIHIEPKREHSLMRMRIDGVLHDVHRIPKNVHPAIVSRIKTLSRMDIAEKRRPQDGRLKTDYGDREVEIRISTMPVAFGEKAVLRIFDPEILMQPIESLGFYPKEMALFRSFVNRPHGIILVTGPTGSGKTTTLYSALRARATEEVNCATIEDPIEMVIEEFNQTAVNVRAGITFASALRTILRQDPDVIMVGEVRDQETARNAVQAAMTGHLVMTTLHTNDTASSVTRMIDLGIEPFLVGSTIAAVVAQRLVRRLCAGCRTTRKLSRDECTVLGMVLRDGESPSIEVGYGEGCALCRGTGLRGRIGVYEVMPITETIRQLIVERADGYKILRAARNDGMMTLRECAIRHMMDGLTSFEEVLRVTVDPSDA